MSDVKHQEEHQRNLWIGVVTLILVFIMAARTPLDTDMWWHLRTGEQTWQNGAVVMADTLSYTRQGSVWTNHSWLSQLGLYGLFKAGGMLGLSLGVALMATISLGILYSLLEGPPILRAFLTILAGVTVSPVWSPRPQLTSLVMLGLLMWIVGQIRKGSPNWFGWRLVPLFILWSNLHGGYALGLIYVGCVLGGEVINRLLRFDGREILSWKQIGILAGWGLAGGLATAINPNGIRMWWIPFQTVGVQSLQNMIPEWASPDFHQLIMQPVMWMLILALFVIGFSGKRLNGVDLLLLMVFGGMALMTRRNSAPFALVAAPVIANHLSAIIITLQNRWVAWRKMPSGIVSNAKPPSFWIKKAINLTFVFLLGMVAVGKLVVVSEPQLVNAYLNNTMPVQAVRWLKNHAIPGNLFNSYTWGGYLTWSLPEKPVFVDGRTDLFGDDILEQYVQVVNGEPGWQAVLDRWNVNIMLIEPYQPVVSQLEDAGWTAAYQDALAVIYTRGGKP
jgi:hypothetical protein